MRLFKFMVNAFSDKEASLVGEENAKTFPTKALIDLESVESAWEDTNGDLIIEMKSGSSYRTRQCKIEEFTSILQGSKETLFMSVLIDGEIAPMA